MLRLEALGRKWICPKPRPIDQYLYQFKSNGFYVESVFHDRFEYKFVDGTTMLNHYFIRLAFIDGWKEIIPIDKQEEVFENIEDELNDISKADGFVKLSVPFVVIDSRKH